MALLTQPQAAGVAKHLTSGSIALQTGVEKTGMSWKAGALLIDDGAGLMIEATSPLIGTTVVAARTLGIAEADARAVAGSPVLFTPLLLDCVIIEMTLSNSGAGTFHVLGAGDRFQIFPVTKATANWYLDTNNASTTTNTVSTTGGGLVIGFRDAVGTTDARVYVRLTHNVIGTNLAASMLITSTSNSLGL